MATDDRAPHDETAEGAPGEGEVDPAAPKPAPTPPKPPSWLMPAGALAALGAGLGGIAYYFEHGPLWVVNGLDIPVIVEIDGSRREIGPGEKSSAWESTGVHRARVLTREGVLIEEDTFHMAESGSSACNVYNVLGAAPVFVQNVEYSASPSNRDREPAIEVFAGQRFLTRPSVDYVFQEPPRSLSVKNAYGVVVKKYAGVGSGGWRMGVGYLAGKSRLEDAAALARSVSRAQPTDGTAAAVAGQLTERAAGLPAAARLASQQLQASPQLEELHRQHQNQQMRLGKLAELQQEYKTWYDAGDRGPIAAALLARVLPPAEARALLDEALSRHPDAPELLLRKAIIATYMLEYNEADALFTKAAASPAYALYASAHAAVLVALGKPQEARAHIERLAESSTDPALAVTYARVSLAPGMGALASSAWNHVNRLGAMPDKAWLGPWARSLLGESAGAPDEGTDADVVRIHKAAGESPFRGWGECAGAAPAALGNVDLSVAVLLGAEFGRAGDLDMAERLLARRPDLPVPWRAVVEHVRSGAEVPGAWRLDLEERAALAFVRSRALAAAGQPADTELALAKRLDVLSGVVTRAMASWSPVAPPGQR